MQELLTYRVFWVVTVQWLILLASEWSSNALKATSSLLAKTGSGFQKLKVAFWVFFLAILRPTEASRVAHANPLPMSSSASRMAQILNETPTYGWVQETRLWLTEYGLMHHQWILILGLGNPVLEDGSAGSIEIFLTLIRVCLQILAIWSSLTNTLWATPCFHLTAKYYPCDVAVYIYSIYLHT